jgi:hypothetical protein
MGRLLKSLTGFNVMDAQIGFIQYVLELRIVIHYQHGFAVYATTSEINCHVIIFII